MKSKFLRLCALLIAISLMLVACGNRGEEPSTTTIPTTEGTVLTTEPTAPSTEGTEPSTEPTDPSSSPVSVEHSISVTNVPGKALSKVDIRVYADSSLTDLIAAGKTDVKGNFTFKRIPGDGYVAVLNKVPTGYGVAEYYELTGESTHIQLTPAEISQEELYSMNFRLGDAMPSFSVTGADGTVYTLSELLQEKKAVVLNFWFMNCNPCKQEFPHIQQAYEKYSDEIEFLAINPLDSSNQQIAQFMQDNGYTFPMLKVDPQWATMFSVQSYPLTLVIDRYGNICLTHSLSVPDVETFEKLFSHFSAEDYTQEFYKSIYLLPNVDQ